MMLAALVNLAGCLFQLQGQSFGEPCTLPLTLHS
jgi:hypothetical protein